MDHLNGSATGFYPGRKLSYFAYIAAPSTADRAQVEAVLRKAGLRFLPVSLAAEHGADALYGLSEPVQEWELSEEEAELLDFPDPDARLRAYQGLAGAEVGFHHSAEVDAQYLKNPLPLPIFRLLRQLNELPFPVVVNLDPDFQIRLGEGKRLRATEAEAPLWEAVAFGDLEEGFQIRCGPP